MKLDGKVAIVTGASAGMGKDIAFYFAKEGAIVYAVARRIERLEELADSAKELKGKIIPVAADLMSQEATENMIEKAYNIRQTKGKEYAVNEDINSAFNDNQDIGISPEVLNVIFTGLK